MFLSGLRASVFKLSDSRVIAEATGADNQKQIVYKIFV
jgi:hypothetical protein